VVALYLLLLLLRLLGVLLLVLVLVLVLVFVILVEEEGDVFGGDATGPAFHEAVGTGVLPIAVEEGGREGGREGRRGVGV